MLNSTLGMQVVAVAAGILLTVKVGSVVRVILEHLIVAAAGKVQPAPAGLVERASSF